MGGGVLLVKKNFGSRKFGRINELLGQIVMQTQPRPQGFSLKKWEKAFSRPSHFLREKKWLGGGKGLFPFFKGKALGKRLDANPLYILVFLG